MFKKQMLVICVSFLFLSCINSDENRMNFVKNNSPSLDIQYSVNQIYPHDTSYYTQGMLFYDNNIYEGTGLYGESKIVVYNYKNCKIKRQIKISDKNFGEGITIFKSKLYQLTWQNNIVYQYDINSLKLLKSYEWPLEGWGITNDNCNLIISTGTNMLYYVNPVSFKIVKKLEVKNVDGSKVENLNELEYVDGFIYANVYLSDSILKIDTKSGKICGIIDLRDILAKSGIDYQISKYSVNTGNVLNGIAYDSVKKSFLITGKKWPALFEIKLNKH